MSVNPTETLYCDFIKIVCMCTCVWVYLCNPEGGIMYLRAGVKSIYELPHMSSENQAWVLWKGS